MICWCNRTVTFLFVSNSCCYGQTSHIVCSFALTCFAAKLIISRGSKWYKNRCWFFTTSGLEKVLNSTGDLSGNLVWLRGLVWVDVSCVWPATCLAATVRQVNGKGSEPQMRIVQSKAMKNRCSSLWNLLLLLACYQPINAQGSAKC